MRRFEGLSFPVALSNVLWSACFICMAIGTSFGQSTLDTLTAQFQKAPTDNALREQIIKTVAEMKPPPVVPEDARRFFVEAAAIEKAAKDAAGQSLRIQSYEKALTE